MEVLSIAIIKNMKGMSMMHKSYRVPQPNNYVVNPVNHWQLGFIADGKILHCENSISYRMKLN